MISNLTPFILSAFKEEQNFSCPFSVAQVNITLLREKHERGDLDIDDYLGREEQEQFCRYKYPKRKYEWLGGRIAAKYAAINFREGKQPVCLDKKMC